MRSAGSIAGFVFVLLTLAVAVRMDAAERGATTDGTGVSPARINLKLLPNKPFGLNVLIDNQSVFTTSTWQAKGEAVVQGVRLVALAEGRSLGLRAESVEVVVEAEGFAGWAAKLPPLQQTTLRVDFSGGMIDLTTPATNTAPMTLRFADGGAAEVKAGSWARFDLYQDQSYGFSGKGQIYAKNADGLGMNVGTYRPPMLGGPWVTITDSKGVSRKQRVSPTTVFTLSGMPGGEMTVQYHNRTLQLKGGSREKVSLPNGTQVEFRQNPVSRRFEWRADKGICQVVIPGFDCWKAFTISGQGASIQWDATTVGVDLKNETPPSVFPANLNAWADLARRQYASVPPGASFQHAQGTDCTTYFATGVGGEVVVYNEITQNATTLSQGQVAFKAGMPLGSETAASAIYKPIGVLGDIGKSFNIQGALGNATVPLNGEQTLTRESGTLLLNNSPLGELSLKSVLGNFAISLGTLPGWAVRLPEGNTVFLRLDMKQGFFTIRAGTDNPATLRINTPEGFSPLLESSAIVNFFLRRGGSQLAMTEGNLVFFENAGADATGPLGVVPGGAAPLNYFLTPPPAFGYLNKSVDPSRVLQPVAASRIFEPPVSTVK